MVIHRWHQCNGPRFSTFEGSHEIEDLIHVGESNGVRFGSFGRPDAIEALVHSGCRYGHRSSSFERAQESGNPGDWSRGFEHRSGRTEKVFAESHRYPLTVERSQELAKASRLFAIIGTRLHAINRS